VWCFVLRRGDESNMPVTMSLALSSDKRVFAGNWSRRVFGPERLENSEKVDFFSDRKILKMLSFLCFGESKEIFANISQGVA
jgi:hypothetical protein